MSRIHHTLAATAISAALALSSAAASAPVLESGTQGFIDALAAAGRPPIYTLSFDDARDVLAGAQTPTIASAATTIEDVEFPVGPTATVRARIVRPEGASAPLPVIMYFHGGGWVMGSPDTHDHLIRELAAAANAAVVFVDYDRAPEVRFPDNNQQAYAATRYVADHGRLHGLDGSRIAIAGDSAGGNMAAAVSLMAKQQGGPAIAHQLLFYPVTDDVSDNASYRTFGNGPWLTTKAMHYFLDANFPADSRDDHMAFPLKASVEQLRGLPPATIIVAENDLLRDEGEAYAAKLAMAGVDVSATRYFGTIHDFVMLNALADSPAAKKAIAQGGEALRQALAE